MTVEEKRMSVEPNHPELSIRHQCDLLGLNRSTLYYEPVPIPEDKFRLMRKIEEIYTRFPFYGVRRMTKAMQNEGIEIGKKRVRRIMRELGIKAFYPKPKLSIPNEEHKIYPYLLRDMDIHFPDQVWCTDITYIRMRKRFIYLVAVMDWYSRFVLSWELSPSLDTDFCLRALSTALKRSTPVIFNSDQGSQFTSEAFTNCLENNGVKISMDGRGRFYDNIFIERLWRSVKYEEVYIFDYENFREAKRRLENYFRLYNNERLHQSFEYMTPSSVYYGKKEVLEKVRSTR